MTDHYPITLGAHYIDLLGNRKLWNCGCSEPDAIGHTTLYFLWDETPGGHRLFYVGITMQVDRRFRNHSRRSWWPELGYAQTFCYYTRRAALAEETFAIATQSPIYNIHRPFVEVSQ